MKRVDCPCCEGTGLDDASGFGDFVPCAECQGTGKVEAKFDAVLIGGVWKAVVHGRMQKPDFNSKGAALAFAEPASRGERKQEPIV